uniref:aldehyde dehydrogenase family protein n=1 Tax=Clavibacter michiganensis TaxID=28447 RepID=UPI0029317492
GGKAATIVTPSANINLAVRAVAFGATGTTGQRCTTLRRLIVHESIYDRVVGALKKAYTVLRIDDPREPGIHSGPMLDAAACEMMEAALSEARADGGIVSGGTRIARAGYYVRPALVEMPAQTDVVKRETFAPILYVLRYRDFHEALHQLQD